MDESPTSRQLLTEPMMQSLSGSFGRRLSMKSPSIKGLPSETPTKKMNHVVLEKTGLEQPAKSKPVTHFGMQVYRKEVFQYEHFQSFGIFIFPGNRLLKHVIPNRGKKMNNLVVRV